MNKFPIGLADQETALNICLRSLASRPNVHFFRQYLRLEHYQSSCQSPEGVYQLNNIGFQYFEHQLFTSAFSFTIKVISTPLTNYDNLLTLVNLLLTCSMKIMAYFSTSKAILN